MNAQKSTAAGTVLTALKATTVLAVKDRELATVAALAAMGRKAVSHLPEHLHGALDAGATQQEIVEGLATISQATGTPTAVNAIAIADQVFKERDANGMSSDAERIWDHGDAPGGTVQERAERSLSTIQQVYPAGPTDDTYTSVATRAPHFWRDAATVFYNDLFNHPGVDIKYRELFVMSTYIALNSTALQMKWHTNGALNTGWTRQEVLEIITQLTPVVGVPNALAAARLAQEVFSDRDARGVTKSHETRTVAEVSGALDPSERSTLEDLHHDRVGSGESWETARTVAPRLFELSATLVFGVALDGPEIDSATRHIALVSALAAHGAEPDQLQLQIEAALKAGVSRAVLLEAVRLSSAIGGYAVAQNAEAITQAVLDRRDSTSAAHSSREV
ncbi:carboxymuconolactone decarboxylase family protein [Mycobacterium sp. DL440]|uniref:carboxymuconolactone decarboxylase family protein n=1 Tax=Mycobacterium sp. DL440 TaxID=2675523 RepID=UPI00141EE419|nr:carboxymuconolactone decarboxylase family protein [Mycobacterium sp. DL440]